MLRSRRKISTPLNVMVVGREGVGKTTFLRTLLASLSLEGKIDPSKAILTAKSPDNRITVHQHVEVDAQGHKINLSMIDTPGLPYSTEQGTELGLIMSYIESQFETSLLEELKVKRNPRSSDTLVHAVLYLLPPILPFHSVDLSAIRTLSSRTNVIPLLAHADSITIRQLGNVKQDLAKTLFATVNLLAFATADLDGNDMIEPEEESEFNEEIASLKSNLPYTVIGAEFPMVGEGVEDVSAFLEVDGKKMLGREYNWGIVNVDDKEHCQLHLTKYLLFDFALPGLRAFTRNILYEKYRTERLMAHAGNKPTDIKEE